MASASSAGNAAASSDRRASQVRAECVARYWPCTIAQPAAIGTRHTARTPAVGVPPTRRPPASATNEIAAAAPTTVSWRRATGPELRHRLITARSHMTWNTT